jgi:hypothetical protein
MEEPSTHATAVDSTIERLHAPKPAAPTEQDRKNARILKEIADRQQDQYGECLLLALGAFGAGWVPSHRHVLIDKLCGPRHNLSYVASPVMWRPLVCSWIQSSCHKPAPHNG